MKVTEALSTDLILELAEQRAELLRYPKDGPWTVSIDLLNGGSAVVSKEVQENPRLLCHEYPPSPRPKTRLRWRGFIAFVIVWLAGGVWVFDYAKKQEDKENGAERATLMNHVARHTCFSIENAPLEKIHDAFAQGLEKTKQLGFPETRLREEMEELCPEVEILVMLRVLATSGTLR